MSEPKETSVIIGVFADPPKGPMPEWGIHPPTAESEMRRLFELSVEQGRELDRLRAENEALRVALDPRRWARAHNDAWHRALPDVQSAFEALRNVAPAPHSK